MKKLFFVLLLLFPLIVIAQVPTYYNDVNLSLTGIALKTELASKITNTHSNELSYSEIYDASKITDLNPLNSLEVLLIYGYEDGSDMDDNNDRERSINSTCGAGSCLGLWNREHVFANSLAVPDLDDAGESGAPYADAHNLRPCDSPTNSSRGNKLFATGTGNSGAVTGGWYPGDEWKGDVARIAMYMYLRYADQCLPNNLGVGSSVSTPDDMIDLFLQWNVEDPVSDFEKQRNTYHDSAGTYAQGNRNPFIDNPAFATEIWGGPQAEDIFGGVTDTEAPTVPTALVSSNITGNSFSITWTASTDNALVTGYNILFNNVQVGTSTTNSYNSVGLSTSTPYAVTVQAYDATGNTSGSSTNFIVNTSADSGTTSTDLFLSEYIEGSSNNKALEVSNYTGATVDLSIYSLKKQTNGAGAWSSGLSLTGTLANGDVFVVANSSSNSTITDVADITTGGTQVTFNGNDPIGLFKNDVLIDIIGSFDGGSSNFAQNMTLQRKSPTTSPNTTYTISEWDTFSTDTFSGIGSHIVSSINTFLGTTDSDWDTVTNWSFGSMPSNSDVIIRAGKTVNAPGSISVANLTLESNSQLTVATNITNSGSVNVSSGASLIAKNSTSFDLTYSRYLETTNWYLVSSPIMGQTIVSFYTNESPALGSGTGDAQNVAIASYDNSQATAADRWAYYTEGQVDGADGDDTTDTFTPGTGYSIKMQTSGDIAFTGTMPTDPVGISTSSNVNAFNLIGNPYPSFLPANDPADGDSMNDDDILSVNSGDLTEETIWFWNQATSSYDQVNQATASRYIAPGQGFFVSSNGSNTFNFTEAMQSHQSTNTFQRTTSTRPEISLTISDGSSNKHAEIFYIDGTTTEFDNGYDSSMFGGVSNPFAIYTHAVANGTGRNLGIQSLPDNNFENMIIPVGVNAASGLEISISAETMNLPAGINVYLEDKDNNSFTLLNSSSNFTTTLSSDLSGIGRFYLHTTSQVLSTNEVNLNNISVYTSNKTNLRIVGIQNGIAKVKLYNILGKQIVTTSFHGNGVNDITIPNVRTGIYIIQLETETGKLNKKVIIE